MVRPPKGFVVEVENEDFQTGKLHVHVRRSVH
jgi:hypothetical protein